MWRLAVCGDFRDKHRPQALRVAEEQAVVTDPQAQYDVELAAVPLEQFHLCELACPSDPTAAPEEQIVVH